MTQHNRYGAGLILAVIVLLSGLHTPLLGQYAQSPWHFAFGPVAGSNIHAAALGAAYPFPRHPDSDNFSNGNGLSLGAAVHAAYAPGSVWSVGLGLAYTHNTALLEAEEQTTIFVNNSPTDATITHSLDVRLPMLSLRPGLSYQGLQPFAIGLGFSAALPFATRVRHSQAITSPPGAGDFDGITSPAAAIPAANSLLFSLDLSAGVDIALGEQWSLHPALSYRHALSDVAAGQDWKVHVLEFGMALALNPRQDKTVLRDTLYRRDTTTVIVAGIDTASVLLRKRVENREEHEGPALVRQHLIVDESYERRLPKPAAFLSAGITARFVVGARETAALDNVPLEHVQIQSLVPLLPYVGFPSGSTDLPAAYRSPAHRQDMPFAPALYYSLLDTLAQRMQRFPRARLQLAPDTGPHAAAHFALLRGYFIEAGLSHERIDRAYTAHTGSIPELLRDSGRYTLLGLACPDEPALLAPLVQRDTLALPISPQVRFRPDVFSEAGVHTWRLRLEQQGRLIREFRGQGAPPEHIEWDMDAAGALWRMNPMPIQYKLVIIDFEGQEYHTPPGSIVFSRVARAEIAPAEIARRYLRCDYLPPIASNPAAAGTLRQVFGSAVGGLTVVMPQRTAAGAEPALAAERSALAAALGTNEQDLNSIAVELSRERYFGAAYYLRLATVLSEQGPRR